MNFETVDLKRKFKVVELKVSRVVMTKKVIWKLIKDFEVYVNSLVR